MLYHKDLGLPRITYPLGLRSVVYTLHARQEAATDKLGSIAEYLPAQVNMTEATIVEVETDDTTGRLVKLVVRNDWDDETDLVSVLTDLDRNVWTAKTVWLSLKADNHRTLDRKRYATTYLGEKVA